MTDTAGDTPPPAPEAVVQRLADVRSSAKNWQGLQMAVIGLTGLCGALKKAGEGNLPQWLEVLAIGLILAALAVALLSVFLVVRVTWPLYRDDEPLEPDEAYAQRELKSAGRNLRTGLIGTFVAAALLALGTSSSWWPEEKAEEQKAPQALIQVDTVQGSVCGRLTDGSAGTITVENAQRQVAVPIGYVQAIRPVAACP